VRRTRLTDPTQATLWPDWRHHAFITNCETSIVEADQFHREHAVVELAIRDLKEGAGLDHIPSGHYHANAAWLACAVLAHNLGAWTTLLADQPPVTNRTRRTRLISLAAVIVNRSGRPTLRLPARWPWTDQFNTALSALRALPAPSG
jgi:Transposase DDE domain group 1